MASENKAASGGIGFTSLLLLAFIILKLTGYINWSWFWVLAPLWIPFVIAAVIISIGLIVVAATRRH